MPFDPSRHHQNVVLRPLIYPLHIYCVKDSLDFAGVYLNQICHNGGNDDHVLEPRLYVCYNNSNICFPDFF